MKKDVIIAILAILFVAAACFALESMRVDLPLTPSQPFAGVPGPKKVKAGNVIMRVNGDPVTEQEFNAIAENVPEQQRGMLASPEGRRLLANEIVRLKTIEQEARRLGIDNDAEVAAQLSVIETQLVGTRGLEKIIEKRVDQLVQEQYEKEKGANIVLRHIVFAYAGGQLPPRSGNPPPADAATRKAASVVARLRGGANFDQTARSESDDPQTGEKGGFLGVLARNTVPPEVAAIIGKLQPGQVSDPVRTPYAVHIFRADPPSLADLRPTLLRNAQQQAVNETLQRLEKDAKVDLDPKFFGPAPKG